jgi:hypothetical protein
MKNISNQNPVSISEEAIQMAKHSDSTPYECQAMLDVRDAEKTTVNRRSHPAMENLISRYDELIDILEEYNIRMNREKTEAFFSPLALQLSKFSGMPIQKAQSILDGQAA